MSRRNLLFIFVFCLQVWVALPAPTVAAGPGTAGARDRPDAAEPDFLALVAADLANGRISDEQSLLYRFQYGFAPSELPPRYGVTGFAPLRCATELVAEYARERDRLSAKTVALIDGWLRPASDKLQYVSPSGRFALSYATSGADAVPDLDLDPANGIPDYVENIARYFDESWAVEVDSLDFAAPPLPGGTYAVSFESMQFYGYTTDVNGSTGETRIVMHNTYVGFPANDDPDGDVAGAAKATAAHEFKHACQFAATRWAEGGWIELDATWIEDIVFDAVNDFYNYLPGESPLSRPEIPLDGGENTTGSYEDCVWQTWMSETWGVGIIQDFWDRREAFTSEAVLESYRVVLNGRGVSLAEGWAAFTAWNYGIESRAVTGLGYEEGPAYPAGPVTATATSYPFTTSGVVQHLAADFVRLDGFLDTSDERLRVVFDGQDSAGPLTLALHVTRRDSTGLIEIITLDENNDADHLLLVPARELATVGVVVGNTATFGLGAAWHLDLELMPIPSLPQATLDRNEVVRTLTEGELGQEVVRVTNTGEAGSALEFRAQLWTTHPDSGLSSPAGAPQGDKSIAGSTLTCAASTYLPGETLHLAFTAFNDSDDDEWLTGVSMIFPPGVSVLASSDFVGGSLGDMVTDNSLGDGAEVVWHGTYGAQEYGVVRKGESAYGTVQVAVAPDFRDDLTIAWSLVGDNYGAAPHRLNGAIMISEGDPVLDLEKPLAGAIYAVGDTITVTWTTGGAVAMVDLDLSRDGGETWSPLSTGVANDGGLEVTLTGPPSNACLMKIRATDGSVEALGDGLFHLYERPAWVGVSPPSGSLMDTEMQDLVLDLDASGLAEGSYHAWLVVLHNGLQSRAVVPISLRVEPDASPVGPRRVFTVHGAHPNPFNPRTTIAFELPAAAVTAVEVLDLRGRLVRRLFQGRLAAGAHARVWDGRDDRGRGASAGTYLVRIRAGKHSGTVKVLLAK